MVGNFTDTTIDRQLTGNFVRVKLVNGILEYKVLQSSMFYDKSI